MGKTSILKRYVNKKFDHSKMATSGVDFQSIRYTSESGEECRVKLWDTAGQERYRTLTTTFIKDADGVLVVFDLNQQDTFHNVRDWIDNIYKHKDTTIPIVLVGNKLDLADAEDGGEREVDTSEA